MVSIIVPIYNSENCLSRCVDSILHQEYTDFELLLCNDGSKDKSGNICDQYAAADARVHVIHKENTGVSDTRNLAISKAKGKYLQFVDSDDWLTPEATKLMVRAAEEKRCDMVITNFYRVAGDRLAIKGDIDEDSILTREEYASHMMENPADFYYGVLWNKLFRRDIIKEHGLRMDVDISWCEDFMFNLEYIRYAERFYALQIPTYYYVKTKGSLANQRMGISRTIKTKLMVFEYYDKLYKHIFNEEDYERIRPQLYRFFVNTAGDNRVPSLIFPGSKKLGAERSVTFRSATQGETALTDLYWERKLLQHYLETVALMNDLTVTDVRILMYISKVGYVKTKRELADITDTPMSGVAMSLHRLTGKKYIAIETEPSSAQKEEENMSFQLLEASDKVLKDIEKAKEDYESMKFAGFTDEEIQQYRRFTSRINENAQKRLL